MAPLKVLDFGLPKVADTPAFSPDAATTYAGSLTQDGLVVGTLPYMSPEQLQGKPLTRRTPDARAFHLTAAG